MMGPRGSICPSAALRKFFDALKKSGVWTVSSAIKTWVGAALKTTHSIAKSPSP